MNFILVMGVSFLSAASALGQKNYSSILGIAKCNGIAVTTHIKKVMFVDLK